MAYAIWACRCNSWPFTAASTRPTGRWTAKTCTGAGQNGSIAICSADLGRDKKANGACTSAAPFAFNALTLRLRSRFATPAAAPGALLGHFRAALARFRQPDRDRLLAAFHFLPRTTGFQFAALHLVHRALDFALRLRTVLTPATRADRKSV